MDKHLNKVHKPFINIFITLFAIQWHSWTALVWIRQILMRLYRQLSVLYIQHTKIDFQLNSTISKIIFSGPGEDKSGSRRVGDLYVSDRRPTETRPLPPQTQRLIKMLLPYIPSLNIAEHAISCLKAGIKADISRLEIQRRMDNRDEASTRGIPLGEF